MVIFGIGLRPTAFGLFSVADLGATNDDGNVEGLSITTSPPKTSVRKRLLCSRSLEGSVIWLYPSRSIFGARWLVPSARGKRELETESRSHLRRGGRCEAAVRFPIWAEHLELVPRGIAEIH